ncbi:MAG: hypothetical protein IKR46_00415 [Clostridia bacterium]|nr:hypothetical protein [Clostridia bacterium]
MNGKIFDVPLIRGVSVTVPKERVVMKDLTFDGVDIEEAIKLTGIEEVRRAPSNMTVTDYSLNAAEHLFEVLNFDKSKIDGVVFATPLGDYTTPGSGYLVQDRLDLSSKCIIVDINQACAGYINGLFQACMLIQSGYCKNVLLCAGDTAGAIHPKDKSMQLLLGDAGAATLISAGDGSRKGTFSFYNEGQSFRSLYTPAGGRKMPIKHGVTDVEEIDEQGNVHTLENPHMNGLEVMAFAIAAASTAIKNSLKIMEWTKDDVEVYALHQANKTILTALTKRLRLPADKVPVSLTYYGNTAAASTPLTLCLESPDDTGGGGKWDKAILCGFGNGLACAAAALDLSETYFCKIQEL